MSAFRVNLRRVKVPRCDGDPKLEPGDFAWDFDSDKLGGDRSRDYHYLYLCLPGGGGGFHQIKVVRGTEPNSVRVWGWDGNEAKPTITPSILIERECHGHVTAGVWVPC